MMETVHHFLLLGVFLGIVGIIAGEAEVIHGAEAVSEQKNDLRKPRLFYVSTSTTTSTLNTMTLCYQVLSTARNLGNCGRRKRAIAERELDLGRLRANPEQIQPSRKVEVEADTLEEDEEEDGREERVLNYWMTTTTTVTSHSYTVTSTFASLLCTYDGFTYATCGR